MKIVSLICAVLALWGAAVAEEITLVWDSPTQKEVTGHILYRRAIGDTAWVRQTQVAMPNVQILHNLPNAGTWEFAVTAHDEWGRESDRSDSIQVVASVQIPEGLKVQSVFIRVGP